MNKFYLGAAGIAALLFVAPSFGATSYYVAHKPQSHACTVVTARPDGKAMLMVGHGSFATAAKANAALKAAADCK
jgi:hypothetical protein